MRVFKVLLAVVAGVVAFVEPAFAQTAEGWVPRGGLGDLAAGLGVAIAAFGGALGQGKVISGAVESISRNPGASGQMFLPWLLGLVFIEALVILTFVVALRLLGLF